MFLLGLTGIMYITKAEVLMKVLFSSIIFLFTVSLSNAQVLRASASIDYEHLPIEDQNNLADLTSNIEDYINNFAWTEDEYETDIDITIFIIIETVMEKSHQKMHKAQFQIKSVSGESFYDKEWEFPYQPGYLFDPSKIEFDPLCDFLDYYCYVVLAGELDGYAINLGTTFYDEAQSLANRGILSKYTKGWKNRQEELQKITNVRTRPLREAKPDYFEAEYLLQEGKIDEAKVYGIKVLDAIEKVVSEQPNNKYLRTFFDAHYVTFAQIFELDNDALNRLIRYDNYHRDTYRQVMD
jgi:hypothetical protein